LALGDLECAGLDGALDFFLSHWERVRVRAYWASTPIDVFVFECHSPFREHKKTASLLSQALIPSPSPKREKGEKLKKKPGSSL
jgi:hypothetical protein